MVGVKEGAVVRDGLELLEGSAEGFTEGTNDGALDGVVGGTTNDGTSLSDEDTEGLALQGTIEGAMEGSTVIAALELLERVIDGCD
jgi:hypothetical protein